MAEARSQLLIFGSSIKDATQILRDNGADQMASKSVYLIRESSMYPGLLTISYYDDAQQNELKHIRIGLTEEGWKAAPKPISHSKHGVEAAKNREREIEAFQKSANAIFLISYPEIMHEKFASLSQLLTDLGFPKEGLIYPLANQATQDNHYSSYDQTALNNPINIAQKGEGKTLYDNPDALGPMTPPIQQHRSEHKPVTLPKLSEAFSTLITTYKNLKGNYQKHINDLNALYNKMKKNETENSSNAYQVNFELLATHFDTAYEKWKSSQNTGFISMFKKTVNTSPDAFITHLNNNQKDHISTRLIGELLNKSKADYSGNAKFIALEATNKITVAASKTSKNYNL